MIHWFNALFKGNAVAVGGNSDQSILFLKYLYLAYDFLLTKIVITNKGFQMRIENSLTIFGEEIMKQLKEQQAALKECNIEMGERIINSVKGKKK